MLIPRRTLAGLLVLAAGRRARAEGALQVGSYPSNPPFEFKNDAGQPQGFEIDLVHAIAAKLGRTVEVTDLGFQALFAATSSRRADMAISSITITPERLKNQDFTQAYIDTNLALLGGPATRLKGMDDLKGATLGAIASSTGEAWIKANAQRVGLAGTNSYDTAQALFLDLQNGRLDGAVNDLAGSLYAFKQMRGMQVLAKIDGVNSIGIMLPKGSALTVPANDAITALKQDGTIKQIYVKWFGVEPPGDSSTIQVMPLPRTA